MQQLQLIRQIPRSNSSETSKPGAIKSNIFSSCLQLCVVLVVKYLWSSLRAERECINDQMSFSNFFFSLDSDEKKYGGNESCCINDRSASAISQPISSRAASKRNRPVTTNSYQPIFERWYRKPKREEQVCRWNDYRAKKSRRQD